MNVLNELLYSHCCWGGWGMGSQSSSKLWHCLFFLVHYLSEIKAYVQHKCRLHSYHVIGLLELATVESKFSV